MPKLRANDIEIAYELWGSPAAPVLVLIQGLGMPLTAWPPKLVELLVEQGFRVLLFDNRDIGHSQMIDVRTPNIAWQFVRKMIRLRVKAPYRLVDMMNDTDQLMQGLNIDSAHVVGISMGGMIAQLLAIHRPARVMSLVSIMSTTGNRRLPGPERSVRRHMMSRPEFDTPQARLEFGMKTWRLIGSPGYPTSDRDCRETLDRISTRGSPPAGMARQMLAILETGSRVKALRSLDVPTLVIHGDSDPLVPLAGGVDTAQAIPGARLEVVPGMGHDLPAQLLEKLAGLIAAHARQAARSGEPPTKSTPRPYD